MTRSDKLMAGTAERLMTSHRTTLPGATAYQLHDALSGALMADIAETWAANERERAGKRQACYLSAEYLIGRQVFNNLYAAGLLDDARKLFESKGAPLTALEDVEDAALGNGGLGRLAACYLDSAATMGLPLTGYGLRYRYGLFKQSFQDGRQVESPDDWMRYGDPWSVRRDELSVIVPLKDLNVRAVPYDMPVLGYKNGYVGTLRLWQTESLHEFDFALFNDQQYARASEGKHRAEDIVKLLYPNDSKRPGKLMRIKQQYVLSSASIQDMLRAYRAKWGSDMSRFARLYAVQLNDTHPTMAIPELIRLLIEGGLTFEEGFEIARAVFSYTNHTVMQEALEVWDLDLLNGAAPGIVPVIERIDQRLKAECPELFIVKDGRVHMANLAVYATHATNGVAKIHSELLKQTIFSAWYARFPERFKNVTNGVTQRRWLGLSNPELTSLIQSRLGDDGFLTHLGDLARLKPMIDDRLIEDFLAVKRQKKAQLAEYVAAREGVTLDPSFVFDVQVKRLHEYKRQLMNALSIWAIYLELKAGNLPDFVPTACLFGAKAAPGYARAKAIISLINQIAVRVGADEAVAGKLKVVFVSDYNCSYAERIIPAAEISEQISPAGTEASGTGNMKLMLNGAITLGTLDGANVEIAEQAGAQNEAIFGATVEEIRAMNGQYNPREIYDSDPLLKSCIDALADGTFDDPDGSIAQLKTALLDGASWHAPDHYYVLKDFAPYMEARLQLNRLFADRRAYAKMALNNIAAAGKFSSDRAVTTYAEEIWGIRPDGDAND